MNAALTRASSSRSGVPPRRRRAPSAALILAALAACAGVGLTGRVARAQETTGRIVGQVTDEATHTPQVGVTVILQGQQGEDAALTDDRGEYSFVNLALGTYTVRFYNATSSTNVERNDLVVSAGATLRADVVIPSQAAPQETYVIKKKAAAVDVGSTRLGLTLNEDYMKNLALDRTFGDLVLKAPGAFLETSGGVSIAGASGLENVYMVDGLNVTGMELGDIMNKRPDAAGGSNLNLDFIKELQINTGGYRAEFGGAMGGVVNVVTKSGTNDLHGSAFMYWSPYWLSGATTSIQTNASVLSGVDKPDYDMNVGFEVGGPLVKDKAFFWVGFAPRLEKSHFFRDVRPLVEDPAGGDPQPGDVTMRTRTRELRQSYQYGVKLDFIPTVDHKLTVSLFQTPTASEHV
ncbi:MAG TPA: carboxypeptidase regulatory-like domain-containing protein, partial [Polyangia bacterium]